MKFHLKISMKTKMRYLDLRIVAHANTDEPLLYSLNNNHVDNAISLTLHVVSINIGLSHLSALSLAHPKK